MNHRIVSAVVVTIVALFLGAAGLFTWSASLVAPSRSSASFAPDNPHPSSRRTDSCLDCHSTARSTIPVTHRNFGLRTCESCHRPAVPVLVPHSVAMGDVRCPLCHGDPARDLGIPANHVRYETRECLLCHPVDTDHYDKVPAPAGLSLSYAAPLPHATDGIFKDCSYCHTVASRRSLPENHRDFAQETCMDCHRPQATKQDSRL